MTAIADAIDALFTDDHLAVDGILAGVPVRVILSRHDPAVDFPGLETQVRSPGWEAHVRQAEVPVRPVVGQDTLTVGAESYTVRDVFEDAERTEWVLDVA